LVEIRVLQKVVADERMLAPEIEMFVDGNKETDFVGRRPSWDILRYGTADFRVHDIRAIVAEFGHHMVALHFSYPRDILTEQVQYPECNCTLEFQFEGVSEAEYSSRDIELLSEYTAEANFKDFAEENVEEDTTLHRAEEIARFFSKLYHDGARRDATSEYSRELVESRFWRTAVRWYAPLDVYPLLKDLNHPESFRSPRAPKLVDSFSVLDCPALSCEGWLMKLAIALANSSVDCELVKRVESEGRESCADFPVSLSLIDGMLSTRRGSMKYDSTFGWFVGNSGELEPDGAGR
jgi:hypothetical protein